MGNACTVHSNTVHDDEFSYSGDREGQAVPHQSKSKKKVLTITMLLLGPAESGKSTLFKQMKILNLDGFSARERLSFIAPIRRNLMVVILTLLNEMSELKIDMKNEVSFSLFEFSV